VDTTSVAGGRATPTGEIGGELLQQDDEREPLRLTLPFKTLFYSI